MVIGVCQNVIGHNPEIVIHEMRELALHVCALFRVEPSARRVTSTPPPTGLSQLL